MQKKEKAQGFKYDFTPSELKALLLHSKKCPDCAGELSKEKTCEMVKGEDVNSSSDPFFVSNIRVNHYGYISGVSNVGRCSRSQSLQKGADSPAISCKNRGILGSFSLREAKSQAGTLYRQSPKSCHSVLRRSDGFLLVGAYPQSPFLKNTTGVVATHSCGTLMK